MDRENNQADPLNNLLEIILKRKFTIILCFLFVFALTLFGTIIIPPVYEAHTTIYINAPTLPRMEVPFMNEFSGRSFVGNQIQILQSRIILEQVVKELNMDRKKNKPTVLGKAKNWLKKTFRISGDEGNAMEAAIAYLSDSIDVSAKRGTNIVQITVRTVSPEGSALIADTMSKIYLNYANSFLLKKTKSGYAFFEKQVEIAEKKLKESEEKLLNFKKKSFAISIQEEDSLIINRLVKVEDEYRRQLEKIENLKEKENFDNKQINYFKISNLDNNEQLNPKIIEYSEQLEKLNTELIIALSQFKEAHPDVKVLRNKITEIQKKMDLAKNNSRNMLINSSDSMKSEEEAIRLQNEIRIKKENEIKKEEKKLANLVHNIEQLKQRRKELQKNQFILDELNRNLQNHQQTFMLLKAKLEDARILNAHENDQESIKIIDRAAIPSFPLNRKKKILMGVGTVVAIIFSIGSAFFIEYLDDSLKFPEEIERNFNVPLLGILPKA